jgi:hypothetical protein
MIPAAAALRLIPHPSNFTPLAALALFGGASFASKRAAFFVLLAGLFLSDLVLRAHHLSRLLAAPAAEYLADRRHNRGWRWRRNAGPYLPKPRRTQPDPEHGSDWYAVR